MARSTTQPLYETDFALWADQTAELIRAGRFEDVDLENVAEEIQDLSRRTQEALGSQLRRIMVHRLKIRNQPQMHLRRWDLSIRDAGIAARKILSENPSLRRRVPELILEEYQRARIKAAIQTGLDLEAFPGECPFRPSDVLEN